MERGAQAERNGWVRRCLSRKREPGKKRPGHLWGVKKTSTRGWWKTPRNLALIGAEAAFPLLCSSCSFLGNKRLCSDQCLGRFKSRAWRILCRQQTDRLKTRTHSPVPGFVVVELICVLYKALSTSFLPTVLNASLCHQLRSPLERLYTCRSHLHPGLPTVSCSFMSSQSNLDVVGMYSLSFFPRLGWGTSRPNCCFEATVFTEERVTIGDCQDCFDDCWSSNYPQARWKCFVRRKWRLLAALIAVCGAEGDVMRMQEAEVVELATKTTSRQSPFIRSFIHIFVFLTGTGHWGDARVFSGLSWTMVSRSCAGRPVFYIS